MADPTPSSGTPEIDAEALARWRGEGRDFVLLDVLPEDAHAEWRIPGSVQACVYRTDFETLAAAVAPDRDRTVVVYGSAADSLDSEEAATRLTAAGWTAVHRFAGGRTAWQEAGGDVEGDRADEPWRPWRFRRIEPGSYAIDVERSSIGWTGRNPSGRHFGTLRVGDGHVVFGAHGLEGGDIPIDMRSIAVDDLPTDALRNQLKAHLESEDFFAVEHFPTARLVVLGAETRADAPPGRPNVDVRAELTLRGHTAPLAFPAQVVPQGATDIALEAHFDIDRTRWGVRYGSGGLFHRLGMHLVHDAVSLEVRLVAR